MNNLKTKNSFKLILAGTLSLLLSNANAALIDIEDNIISGVGAYAAASNSDNCPSFCIGGSSQRDSSGGEGATEAEAVANSDANAHAYSGFVPGSFLPLLRVETSADLRKKGGASAFSIQNFTNIGTETKTIELDINLHGSVSDNAGGYSYNQLRADIAIIRGTSLEWYPNFSTLAYEFGNPIQSPTSLFINTGIDVNVLETITFNVDAGESFYIVSSMDATSNNGFSDAWNTLSMSFTDGSNLQAALQVATPQLPTGVPEPETILLFGLGLMGVFLRARKN